MRAEDTLQFMMDFYPDLYKNRKDCLNQLFCIIGNGYEWVNGELVCESEYLERWQLKASVKHATPGKHNLYLSERREKFKKRLAVKINKPVDNSFDWYPLSKKYSKLYNYPEDIKDDWLLLIEETKQCLKEDGIEF